MAVSPSPTGRRETLTSTSHERTQALQALAATLREQYEGVSTELSVFPSGAAFLDARRDDRAWVLAYSPTHAQFGVDELGDHDGFTTSYRYTTSDLAEAARILTDLLTRPPMTP